MKFFIILVLVGPCPFTSWSASFGGRQPKTTVDDALALARLLGGSVPA